MTRRLASTCLALTVPLWPLAFCLVSCSTAGTTLSSADGAVDGGPGGGVGSGGRRGSGGESGTGGRGAGGQGIGGGAAGEGGVGGSSGSDGKGAGGEVDAGGDAPVDKPPATEGSPCSANTDCDPTNSHHLVCQAPDEFLGCGACQVVQDRCTTDDQCALDAGPAAGAQICLPLPANYFGCYCNSPRLCVAGCRTSDVCGAGQACNTATHGCEHTCVAGDGTCPIDSVCSTAGFCVKKGCKADSECSGACVKGICYSERGRCEYPPV